MSSVSFDPFSVTLCLPSCYHFNLLCPLMQANHPDEKFKILMTRLLITARYVFITKGFFSSASTWREAKGSCFLMEQEQQAACDLLTLGQGSRDRAASWERWRTYSMSWPRTPVLIIYPVRWSGGWDTSREIPISDIWQLLEIKCWTLPMHQCVKNMALFIFFVPSFFWDTHSYILFHAISSCSSSLSQPPNVSSNELLSRVSAAVIAYKMYNFTVNQI